MAVYDRQTLIFFGLFLKICTLKGDIKVSTPETTVTTNGTVFQDWVLKRVVDGNIGDAACKCCSAIKRPAWVQLYLPKPYYVKQIVLKGRTGGAYRQFENITLSSGFDENNMVDQNFTSVTNTIRKCVISPPQAMQVIRVIGQGGIDYLTICEMEVYRQEDCINGTYGPDCVETCHCLEGPCDSTTGSCKTGCLDGWRGAACNESCEHGRYGQNCSLICSANCRNKELCNHVNGTCPNGCEDGYHFYSDNKCTTTCEQGFYGLDCSLICSANCRNKQFCNHINGTCPNDCEDGYDFYSDNKCTSICAHGLYGLDCSLICSANCRLKELCNHVNGTCPNGCEDGYDFYSDNKCTTTCAQGFYGRDCSLTCSANCWNKQICHHINGTCPSGCEDGYDFHSDNECTTACIQRTFGENCSMDCHCEKCHHVNGSCAMFVQQCDFGYNMENGVCKPCEQTRYGHNCSIDCHCEQCHNLNGSCALYTNHCDGGYQFENELCKPCRPRYYGQNCSMDCHCEKCHNVNGSCALYTPHCDVGYRMENELCREFSVDEMRPSSFAAAIGGSVGASAVVLIVIVVPVIYYRRRHVKTNSSNREFFNDIATCSSSTPQSSVRSEKLPKSPKNAKCETNYTNAKAPDTDYYSFSAVASGIQLHELWAYIREKSQFGSIYFEDEFEKLPTGLVRKHDVASAGSNKGKHRYKELYAYDDSRVVLEKDSPSDSDYINASYIHGFGKLNKFIASQD